MQFIDEQNPTSGEIEAYLVEQGAMELPNGRWELARGTPRLDEGSIARLTEYWKEHGAI